jgi:hypothetical protein
MRNSVKRENGAWMARLRNRIAQLVNDEGSNAAFARRVEVHDRRVTDWTNTGYGRMPSAENLYAIGKHTGCSLDWLFGLSHQRNRDQTRKKAELADDVAAYLRREVSRRVGLSPDELSVSGLDALDRLAADEAQAFIAERKREEAIVALLMRRFQLLKPNQRPRLESPEWGKFRKATLSDIADAFPGESPRRSSIISIGRVRRQ